MSKWREPSNGVARTLTPCDKYPNSTTDKIKFQRLSSRTARTCEFYQRSKSCRPASWRRACTRRSHSQRRTSPHAHASHGWVAPAPSPYRRFGAGTLNPPSAPAGRPPESWMVESRMEHCSPRLTSPCIHEDEPLQRKRAVRRPLIPHSRSCLNVARPTVAC